MSRHISIGLLKGIDASSNSPSIRHKMAFPTWGGRAISNIAGVVGFMNLGESGDFKTMREDKK
jgi:hypothetical protein